MGPQTEPLDQLLRVLHGAIFVDRQRPSFTPRGGRSIITPRPRSTDIQDHAAPGHAPVPRMA
jgi:hypothetical protein